MLNYARLYGAGKTAAKQKLMELDPKLTPLDAQAKVHSMYPKTKGMRRKVPLTKEDHDHEDAKLCKELGMPKKEKQVRWVGFE